MRLWQSIRDWIHTEVSLDELIHPRQAMARARRIYLLLRETIRSISRHQSLVVASALAFKTLTALVPVLMISVIVVGSLPPPEGSDDGSMTEFFITVLTNKIPDAPEMAPPLIALIESVARHATEIKIIGFLLLFITVYSLLFSIESSFNMIWQVKKQRPLLGRMIAYLTTVILVPILLTLSFLIATNFTTRATRWLDEVQITTTQVVSDIEKTGMDAWSYFTFGTPVLPESDVVPPAPEADAPSAPDDTSAPSLTAPAEAAADDPAADDPAADDPAADDASRQHEGGGLARVAKALGSLLTTVLALAALYYFMPFTRVKVKSALAGGLFAGAVIEGIRIGFHYYTAHASTNLTVLYGGTLLAIPLILLWLWLVWAIVLIGAEIAFTSQNFADLAVRAELERRGLSCRNYFAVRIVLLVSEYFHRGEAPEELVDRLADALRLPPYAIREMIGTLLERNILRQVTDGEDAYLPAKDIAMLSVGEVVRAVTDTPLTVADQPDDLLRRRVKVLFENADAGVRRHLDAVTFAELVEDASEGQSGEPACPHPEIPGQDAGLTRADTQILTADELEWDQDAEAEGDADTPESSFDRRV